MVSEIFKTHEDLKNGKILCASLVSRKIKELEGSPNNTANYLLTDTALEKASKLEFSTFY